MYSQNTSLTVHSQNGDLISTNNSDADPKNQITDSLIDSPIETLFTSDLPKSSGVNDHQLDESIDEVTELVNQSKVSDFISKLFN
jgi:hypothetical protein